MSSYGVYKVIGRREYRGHKPGETFEADLDRHAEARAITRGDIRLIERFTPDLIAGSYQLPYPWPPGQPSVSPATTETPNGVSFIEGGG